MADPYDLQRFVDAQEPVIDRVLAELQQGRKTSHWMWFIFPQIRGLGRSPMAERFAVASLEEARAFLDHPILGPRLRRCTALVNAIKARPIDQILDPPDDLKFRSSMTLFARAATENRVFVEALDAYFAGQQDTATLALMKI